MPTYTVGCFHSQKRVLIKFEQLKQRRNAPVFFKLSEAKFACDFKSATSGNRHQIYEVLDCSLRDCYYLNGDYFLAQKKYIREVNQ